VSGDSDDCEVLGVNPYPTFKQVFVLTLGNSFRDDAIAWRWAEKQSRFTLRFPPIAGDCYRTKSRSGWRSVVYASLRICRKRESENSGDSVCQELPPFTLNSVFSIQAQLPKLDVAGSIPVSRSILSTT
jgi:hypothetical protein